MDQRKMEERIHAMLQAADNSVNAAKAMAYDRLRLQLSTMLFGSAARGVDLDKLEAWEHTGTTLTAAWRMPGVNEPKVPTEKQDDVVRVEPVVITETVEDPEPEPEPAPEPTPEPKPRRRRPRGRAVSQVKPAEPKKPEAAPEPATPPDVRPADGEGLEPLGTVEPNDDGTLAGLFDVPEEGNDD